MRKVYSVIAFAIIMLLVGRNLTFLPRFELFTNTKSQTENLKTDIANFTKKQPGSYSVYYYSFDKDASFGVNENQIHTVASVNKVPIVAVLYYLAKEGKINLDERIALQKVDIQDYGTGSLRYQKPGTLYSLKTLAKLALKQSDNTAAYILASKIGRPEIQKHLDSWGLEQTSMERNKSSVYDMYILYKKIYNNEITGAANTKELLGFMKDTDFEDRLPSLIKPASVYHKTGDEVGLIHDIGIIEKNGSTFFLGVFTSDIGDKESETKKAIGEIAKKVVDFEKNLK